MQNPRGSRDRGIDALVAFMRLQNGVEHVGDAHQTLFALVRLIEKRILDAFLGLVVRATNQPFEQGERRIRLLSGSGLGQKG